FGGKNPFTAEVWFVNKVSPLNIDWRVSSMRILDPDYQSMIPLTAAGRYGLKVADAERFLVKLVGTLTSFTANDLTDHFYGALTSKTKTIILSFMNANRIGVNGVSAQLDPLSNYIKQPMAEFWEDWGFDLAGFFITDIDIDKDTPDGQKILEAMTQRSAQNIAGYTWQQGQSFDVARNALTGGGDMGIMGAVMMTGGLAGSGAMGQMMMQQPGNQNLQGQPQASKPKEVFCSNCAKKYPSTSKFCPHCGDAYNPCPACGADNPEKSARCVMCGSALTPAGSQGASGNACGRCGCIVDFNVKFCPNCGNKVNS
ncbi:MAG TPA: SPFH domain-containing protein, partial [Treponemataceae bacterium]|nr:SPFH domain-containing protein [Treponemataceae bacterium]